MVVLIAGGTHTGKTLAQRLLETYHIPFLSIDHLKMGLIRSGYCSLTPESDDTELTQYLWPIIAEIAKTAVENHQNLMIEGCYIPFDYKAYFEPHYLQHLRYICLIFSEDYIQNNYSHIVKYANQIEHRTDDSTLTKQALLEENINNLKKCKMHGLEYLLIDDTYEITWNPFT